MKGKRKEEDKEEYRQLKEKNKFWGNKQKNAKIIKAKNKRPAGNDVESISINDCKKWAWGRGR